MEAPPPLTTTTQNHFYQDSIDSSPRSRTVDTWQPEDPSPPQQLPPKLRLMCSYGGHIVPRPHDKSLCYVGGDTRIITVDRHNTSLSDIVSLVSKSFLRNNKSPPFTIKYQLPNEDLDNLISVTTDEDLDNMIHEYDRVNSESVKPSRLRLFLFLNKVESTSSMIELGSIFDTEAKSEDWFLSALNCGGGSGGAVLMNRTIENTTTTVDSLLELDDDDGANDFNGGCLGTRDLDGPQTDNFDGGGRIAKQQDVHSVPDSPMLDTTSSFGSTSSSPPLANLPRIRVHVEENGGGVRVSDQKLGIEEQFAQITIAAASGGGQKQDDGLIRLSSPQPPSMIASTAVLSSPVSSGAGGGGMEYQNRVYFDEERSEQGIPVGYGIQPQGHTQNFLHTLIVPQQMPNGALELASPDSVSSDGSYTNTMYRQNPMIYKEPVTQTPMNIPDTITRLQIQQQAKESGYVMQSQLEQHHQQQHQQLQQQQRQQYLQAGAHYIHQYPSGAVPMSSYYPVYPSQQQQQQQQHQQYPVYMMPTRQPQQSYSMSMQQTNQPAQPNPEMINSSASYNPAGLAHPPISDMASGSVYRTAVSSPLVQVAPNQHQQQYVGYSQVHNPPQSMPPNSGANANYGYEYVDPNHAHLYYAQAQQSYGQPSFAAQYQTMPSAVMLPEASSQSPHTEQMKQQNRTTQAL